MISLPQFTSYSVAGPSSDKVTRATEIEVERSVHIDEATKEEITIETSNVLISEEAYDKLKIERQSEAIRNKSYDTDNLVISQGLKIDNPNELSEEESKALLDSLNEDPMTKMYREIDERFQAIDRATLELRVTTEALEQTYTSLMERIKQNRPDLADKAFGFSVNAEGKIILLNTKSLNSEQVSYLEQTLNGSSAMVEQAIDVANAHISLTEAEWWQKGIILDRENYAKTIDLGADLSYRRASKALPRGTNYIPAAPVNLQNYWRYQLISNGEKNPAFLNKS